MGLLKGLTRAQHGRELRDKETYQERADSMGEQHLPLYVALSYQISCCLKPKSQVAINWHLRKLTPPSTFLPSKGERIQAKQSLVP